MEAKICVRFIIQIESETQFDTQYKFQIFNLIHGSKNPVFI